jgi:O-antigen polysaccharide polymerase Wzy-like protein
VLVVVAAKRGFRLGLFRVALATLVTLWLISYVGETRTHGVTEGVVDAEQVGPVNALVEMGGSLETTSLTLDWIHNGDAYLLGGGYWLPFERAFGLVLPIRSDLAADPRAMNLVLTSRASGLGGSSIAESYYNFSVFGALFFLALGFLLAHLDIAACSPNAAAMSGVILYAFIFQARNWFISVPSMILLGSAPVLACIILDLFARRKREREGFGEGFGQVPAGVVWPGRP